MWGQGQMFRWFRRPFKGTEMSESMQSPVELPIASPNCSSEMCIASVAFSFPLFDLELQIGHSDVMYIDTERS